MDAEISRKSEDQVCPLATVLLQCIYEPYRVSHDRFVDELLNRGSQIPLKYYRFCRGRGESTIEQLRIKIDFCGLFILRTAIVTKLKFYMQIS